MTQFEDKFMEVQVSMISLALEYVQNQAEKVYIYCISEEALQSYKVFYKINGIVIEMDKVNEVATNKIDDSDNMAFALKLRKVPKDEIKAKVEEAAKILGLEELLDRKPKALSGGQRQRVALGRAIVRSPKVFLMDEPLSNLDAKLRSNMRAEIIKIHNTLGATTIYVTHDQTEAMTMADRIVVMKKGVVQQVGSPKDIYDHPENLFVAGFIGAPTMNFMRGKVVEGNFVTKGGGNIEIPVGYYEKLKELGYEGKEVVLGIRPENISNDPLVLETYSHAKITSKVIVAELLGSEYIVHTDLNGENIKAIVHSRQNIKMGDELTFALDMNRAHFFDVDTELSILD